MLAVKTVRKVDLSNNSNDLEQSVNCIQIDPVDLASHASYSVVCGWACASETA